jgi:hypothetical protein
MYSGSSTRCISADLGEAEDGFQFLGGNADGMAV